LQQVQSFNPQDSLAFSNPSVLNLQNSPFANNANMTSFFTNFLSNFQNQMMQNFALNNQKIKQQSEARLNQASTDLNSARGERQGLQNQVSQLESEIQNLQGQQGWGAWRNYGIIQQKQEQLKELKGKLAQADQKVKILGMRYNQFSSMSSLVSSSINLGGGGGISGQLPPNLQNISAQLFDHGGRA
ncbi:MAG: hypothetical protein HYU63_06915, partial [Armatimonadetes bacterium]|nr:hypothetical protein [Armatimonadota bacterium]